MLIAGVDPGTTESAYCVIDDSYRPVRADKLPNAALIGLFSTGIASVVAMESIQSYGSAFGASTIETCYVIGRLLQRFDDLRIPCELYPRPRYAKAICGVSKISDAIVKSALEQRFGNRGIDAYKKGQPLELLRGNSDKRSAFAVAAYHLDLIKSGGR